MYVKGDYLGLYESSPITKLITPTELLKPSTIHTFVTNYLSTNQSENYLILTLHSLALHSLYLQLNYTGPSLPHHPTLQDPTFESSAKIILSVEGDLITPVSKGVGLFAMSIGIMTVLSKVNTNDGGAKAPAQESTVGGSYYVHVHLNRMVRCYFELVVFEKGEPPYSNVLWEVFERGLERVMEDEVMGFGWRVGGEGEKVYADNTSVSKSIGDYLTSPLLSSRLKSMSTSLLDERRRYVMASTCLEVGITCSYFKAHKQGKPFFELARVISGLEVEVTGRLGRKTKFQEEGKAQMIVIAKSREGGGEVEQGTKGEKVDEKKVPKSASFDPDNPMHESTQFVDPSLNTVPPLTTLDQCILLSLCLDVKNTNPSDGLTATQMTPYLERVLKNKDDWMIYSTALLERSWLESESNHKRERAVLQIQALVDQHEEKLTITQSTYKAAVEDSKGAEERLKNVHRIVYPPRWGIKRDLGERYAAMGILTSAAEIFTELHLWDEVVECYTHAGRKQQAEEVVRREIERNPTPRMYAALGDITDEEDYYRKSWELSGGKYARAMAAMGRMRFDKGDFRGCYDCMVVATKVKPLSPSAWFLLGSVSMRLKEFKTALSAFSHVVQQVPEDCDAWANVGSIHIHNKNPESAYPALCESLRFRRQNWRVWINKLYVCMDLGKWDEAVQAVHTLLDFKTQNSTMKDIPDMDERVVRGLVTETIKALEVVLRDGKGKDSGDYKAKIKTCERVGEMLGRISSVVKTEAWVWEAYAEFNERLMRGETKVMDCLMKVHRCLSAKVWGAGDDEGIEKLCKLTVKICGMHMKEEGRGEQELKQSRAKAKFLARNVVKKLEKE
eukprot:CAMPEP_0118664364 /NCGR_PEP_ID=MMETSP0785-20121206/17966_1 /TAXON_ID=91992 /ORGANISM="Bolidomonas pacifica, Strain CCMP 1866" /LENGTH=843 /DNA_ID=CAMNT_0006558251 /DNA_START=139 /DNA_END=2667 /DNA_ORIENTATION=+